MIAALERLLRRNEGHPSTESSEAMSFPARARLRSEAAIQNRMILPREFQWCEDMIDVGLDTCVHMSSDNDIFASRSTLQADDPDKAAVSNVVFNLIYDAIGTCMSTHMLATCGVMADSWSLLRGAFESACHAEFFSKHPDKVESFLELVPFIEAQMKGDTNVNMFAEMRKRNLTTSSILRTLSEVDGVDRTNFYGRLSSFGVHASPVRSGLRFSLDEEEVRSYLSVGHRYLPQCVADLASVTKYSVGLLFEVPQTADWPHPELTARYRTLEDQYRILFPQG